MRYKKGDCETPLQSLPAFKIKAVDNISKGIERIWVAVDAPNKKMYLLSNSVAFFPYPSWGAEFPLSEELCYDSIKEKKPKDVVLTLHPESFEEKK